MPDQITNLLSSPVARRIAGMLVRRAMLAAGPVSYTHLTLPTNREV